MRDGTERKQKEVDQANGRNHLEDLSHGLTEQIDVLAGSK